MYWDIDKTLSRGAFLNLIQGNRGGGKTYGSKKWVGKHYLKSGNKFMWVRRYKDEFTGNAKFWAKVQTEFPGHEMKVKGDSYLIDGQQAGYKMVLSTSRMRKGIEYPDCDTIVFDEFLIDKGVYHYLPGDVEIFLDLIDTVFRGREDVRVICLANAISVVNPYFDYFHVRPPEGVGCIVHNDILVENVADPDFIEQKKQSRFGRLILGTEYGAYNMENAYRYDSPEFIEKKQGQCKYLFTLIYKKEILGVWMNMEAGKIYCTASYDPKYPQRFALTLEDHAPNTLLLSTLSKNYYLKMFAKQFRLGNVYAESQKVKKVLFAVQNLLKSA